MAQSKIFVDLRARTFEIEVPDERIDDILTRLEGFFRLPQPITDDIDAEQQHSGNEEVSSPREQQSVVRKRTRNQRGNGKARAYELLDLGFDQKKSNALRDFFAEKNPQQQNDQVAVLSVKLKEFTGKSEFTADEIHSAFKIVSKPTPRNLVAVFGNMKRDGIAGYKDLKVIVNSHTEDYVSFRMDSKKSKK